MEPARQSESRKLIDQFGRPVLQNTVDGVNVKVILEPGDVGPNLATVFLTDRSGKPITNASLVTLELTYLDSDIGTTMEDIINHGGGIWVAHQPVLSVAGNWQATFTIKRPDAFDVRTSFKFRVPLLAGGSGISVSAETGRRLWGVEMLFLGFLLGGIATTFGRWWARSSVFFFATGIVLAITAIIVIVAG